MLNKKPIDLTPKSIPEIPAKEKIVIPELNYEMGTVIGGIKLGGDDSTINNQSVKTIADAISAEGNFINNVINTNLDTFAKQILGDFTFGVSGAIQIGTYVNGVSGDIKISPNGIIARNLTGANTIAIDGTTGEITAIKLVGTSGSIGGWNISATALYYDGATDNVSAGMSSVDYPFYAGTKYANRATAPFRITPNGSLFASSVEVTGKITAGVGSSIASNYLSGIIAQANLNVSNRGWVQACAFTVASATQINWGAGTFTSADGTAYSIGAGNTGVMATKTYIYLDTAVSTIAYQITTTVTTAVGAGKVLIAIAQNDTNEATFFVFNGQGGLNINASNIVASSITSTELADLAVSTAKLAANAITTAKIAADAVTAAEIAIGAVGSTELAAGAVIAGKITAGTIVSADIAAGTITGANIAAITITANNIAAGAITTAKIAALAVTANEIAANTITAAKIAAGTITTTQIAANTIVAGNIVAGTITGNEIAASTITSGKLSVTQLSAITADMGEITAGTLTGLNIQTATSGQRIRLVSAAGTSPTQNANSLMLINTNGDVLLDFGSTTSTILTLTPRTGNPYALVIQNVDAMTTANMVEIDMLNSFSTATLMSLSQAGSGMGLSLSASLASASNKVLDVSVGNLQRTVVSFSSAYAGTNDQQVLLLTKSAAGQGTVLKITNAGVGSAIEITDTETLHSSNSSLSIDTIAKNSAIYVYAHGGGSADAISINQGGIGHAGYFSRGSGDNANAVLFLTQSVTVGIYFKKMITMIDTTIWRSDGTHSPNAVLTGTAGDICFNCDSGKAYYCQGTTTWIAM